MIDLSPDQESAVQRIHEFFRGDEMLLTMGGFAGSGKTTVLSAAIGRMVDRPSIAFCALSGKAASVLKKKLEASGSLREDQDYCGTIHGLMYEAERVRNSCTLDVKTTEEEEVAVRQPITETTRQKIDWRVKGGEKYGVIIIDEASMVNEEIYSDLVSLHTPIIAVGDHGQLPPIGGRFNLMENPMIRLEKIHRQAEGDPIIKISMMARESGRIPIQRFGEDVEKIQATGRRDFASRIDRETMVLCAKNDTRVWWNNALRSQYGYKDFDPMVGERVICLKNNHQAEIYNGMTGIIREISNSGKHWYWLSAEMDNGVLYTGKCLKHQFGSTSNLYNFTENGRPMAGREIGDLFDWGWATTVHKFQGSEAESVVVLEERLRGTEEDWKKWLYTAVSRSKKRLLIVGT